MKKSFVLYNDMRARIDRLPDEQAGKLIKAVFAYVNGDEPELTDPLVDYAFGDIQATLDRDREKWEDARARRVEAGRAGGLAKSSNAKQCLAKPSNATKTPAKPSNATKNLANPSNATKKLANLAVSVSGSVSDTVNVSDNVSESGSVSADGGNASATGNEEPTQPEKESIPKEVVEACRRNNYPIKEATPKNWVAMLENRYVPKDLDWDCPF